MASKIVVKRKRMIKKKRSSSKGTMRRRKVTVRNKGKGNANVAMVRKP